MAEVRIDAELKQLSGTGVARKVRAQGKVPAVIYGRGIETTAIQVNRRELATALNSDAGMNVLLDLQIEGKSTLALTRELQRDPVRGTLLHADFVRVDRTQAVEVEVPIHVVAAHAVLMRAECSRIPCSLCTSRACPPRCRNSSPRTSQDSPSEIPCASRTSRPWRVSRSSPIPRRWSHPSLRPFPRRSSRQWKRRPRSRPPEAWMPSPKRPKRRSRTRTPPPRTRPGTRSPATTASLSPSPLKPRLSSGLHVTVVAGAPRRQQARHRRTRKSRRTICRDPSQRWGAGTRRAGRALGGSVEAPPQRLSRGRGATRLGDGGAGAPYFIHERVGRPGERAGALLSRPA